MRTLLPVRALTSFTVWTVSAAAVFWLARGVPGVGDAPAQVVAEQHRIAAVETARLADVLVTPGQRVRPGQVLARLDSSVLEREIAVAEAHLRQLASETHASVTVMDSDGYQTERSFQADLDDAAAQLESARAAQSQQAAELSHLREEIARQRQFVREGLAKADRLDELEVRRKTLEDALGQWPARIDAMSERLRAATERLREWRLQHRISSAPGSRQARLQPWQDRASEQLEALRVLRVRLESYKLAAPAEADVISVLALPGDVARPGEPIIVLNGTGPRHVVGYVSEREGGRLAPGARALLRRRTPAREEFETRVTRVADVVVQLPPRFWIVPALPQWGREVFLEMPAGAPLTAGEALDVEFLAGGGL